MILKGDCIEIIKAIKPNSVDAVITDPPYNLHFMGKDWDKDLLHERWLIEAYRVLKPGGSMLVMGGTRTFHRLMCAVEDNGFIIKDTLMWLYGSGFPKAQDASVLADAKILGISTKEVKERREKIGVRAYLREGTTPVTRKATSIYSQDGGENVGQDSNMETKPLTPEGEAWDGFKIGGIKPSFEPIIWAIKPPEGSYIDNVLKWRIGAVNVDECRINHVGQDGVYGSSNESCKPTFCDSETIHDFRSEKHTKGRFPSNVILSHHSECVQVGMKRVKGDRRGAKGGIINYHQDGTGIYGKNQHKEGDVTSAYGDSSGLETVESWRCHPDCPVRMLDEQSGNLQSGKLSPDNTVKATTGWSGGSQANRVKNVFEANSGGASRFFYCAKASRSERNRGLKGMEEKDNRFFRSHGGGGRPIGISEKYPDGSDRPKSNIQKNNHPTVKPIALFEWLIKLVTRKRQVVLDPFLGSGTTAISAHNTGRKCIGIEREDEYLEIAKKRIDYWKNQPQQLEFDKDDISIKS